VIGHEIGRRTGEELVRFVRALGQHRYVASRLHLVHVFAVVAASENDPEGALTEASAWARRAISAGVIELDSKDERLQRRATDAELVAVLKAFWSPGGEKAQAALREHLASIKVTIDDGALPFDEQVEDEVFPVLVDAGWELLPLTKLDAERHRGAIQAFDDFEVARFEEENAVPPSVILHELPVLGAVELCEAFDGDGRTRAPFVLWTEGNEIYVDYVLRGVLRAAKIDPDADPES
jgi:hypothetical protein